MRYREKIRMSWLLMKNSFQVIQETPKILLLSALGMAGLLAILLPYGYGLYKAVKVFSLQGNPSAIRLRNFFLNVDFFPGGGLVRDWAVGPGMPVKMSVVVVGILLILCAIEWLTVWCQVATIMAVQAKFRGERMSLRRSLGESWRFRRHILEWVVLSGLVNTVLLVMSQALNALEKIPRFGHLLASLVMNMAGLAWNVASFFVLPILVTEKISPLDAVKRSVLLVKRHAGETVIGILGMSTIMGIVFVPILMGTIGFMVAGSILGTTVIISSGLYLFLGFIGALLATSPLMTSLHLVYSTALYAYAVEGVPPGLFPKELLDRVWVVKSGTAS